MSKDVPVTGEFGKLVRKRGKVDLLLLLLELAADAYPGLDAAACLAEVERLGKVASQRVSRLGPEADLAERLRAISRLLYGAEGFSGNREAYYDPLNSYLNQVLERRRGIPITLGILYMAVAERAGVPTFGVCAPGHFVVGAADAEQTLFVDPFEDGDVLDEDACRERIEVSVGKRGIAARHRLAAASSREIGVRVLRNLKAALAREDRWQDLLPVQQRLALLLADSADERRDLGLIYLRLGLPHRALTLLEGFLGECNPDQARNLKPFLQCARRMAAEMN